MLETFYFIMVLLILITVLLWYRTYRQSLSVKVKPVINETTPREDIQLELVTSRLTAGIFFDMVDKHDNHRWGHFLDLVTRCYDINPPYSDTKCYPIQHFKDTMLERIGLEPNNKVQVGLTKCLNLIVESLTDYRHQYEYPYFDVVDICSAINEATKLSTPGRVWL